MRHVLTHELTHYAHKDHIWSVVRCVCLCVYWFDPLVWVAAWFSRRDCELACDEGALKRLGEGERIAYGRSLLDVVSHASTPANLMQTATSMNESKKQLRERVNFIVKKQKISIIAAVCMVIVCAIVAGCAAAGPADTLDEILSDERRERINCIWRNEKGRDIAWETVRYYGNYENSTVLFEEGALDVISSLEVAGYRFEHQNSFQIYVCTEEKIYTLKEAYERHLFDKKTIALIHECHMNKEY